MVFHVVNKIDGVLVINPDGVTYRLTDIDGVFVVLIEPLVDPFNVELYDGNGDPETVLVNNTDGDLLCDE